MKRNKTALLTEIISPYRIPVFNAIAEELGEQFKAFFFAETEKRRLWGIQRKKIKFRYEVLPGICLQKAGGTPYFLNQTIIYRLCKFNPDVTIIGGYHHPSSLLALIYAKLFGKRLILWAESNRYEHRSNSLLKVIYKRWFVRNCTEYIVSGQASFEYLTLLGAPQERIWVAPNAVDNRFFSEVSEKARGNIEDFKNKKGYPEKIILYVGHLIDEKGIQELLEAFKILLDSISSIGLVLIGRGKDETKYKRFCEEKKLTNVYFEGFIPQSQLPNYYAATDVFVLPTHSDAWGLVLNEAMACKLPVIATDVTGASQDLIYEGVNGYIYRKGDINALFNLLKQIFNQNLEKMGEESFRIIQRFSPQRCAQGFIEAIKQTKNLAYEWKCERTKKEVRDSQKRI